MAGSKAREPKEENSLPMEHTVEFDWYMDNAAMLVQQYPPRDWLCIVGQEVVAHAPSLADALAMARQQGHMDPFIARVPGRRPGVAVIV